MDGPLLLGIESSCDETAAAVLRGRTILSNIIASQVDVHREFGGVVPELASRHHLEKIDLVIDLALKRAGVTLADLDGVAVTYGPGLVGSLLVGLQAAKAIAYVRKIPLLAVNHLEGHLRSVWLDHGEIPTPALSLVASGGHTSLYLSPSEDEIVPIARTRDDAAGEAFDKVAKLLGLGYPGGPVVDRLAPTGNPRAVRLSPPKMSDGSLDFSFSGFKTAVLRHVQAHELARDYPAEAPGQQTLDLLASFQTAVVEFMVDRVMSVARPEPRPASREDAAGRGKGGRDGGTGAAPGAPGGAPRAPIRSVCLSGGVACNSLLRSRIAAESEAAGLRSFAVRRELAVDNAAMIAEVGRRKLLRREFADLSQNADPGLEI